ncbi:protein FAR1-RELATED SEQUENCE 5-like [Rhododendron vialii]|uniref:protein FAR1-RELATED SEQUENCE 5-like n=1 Tax=Rhododendron vialii TaxID=182163 RepID=UPI00265D86DC|nr:protein FAR1-RELATED SEQUENCE 5-like [Rhododendron vialii]
MCGIVPISNIFPSTGHPAGPGGLCLVALFCVQMSRRGRRRKRASGSAKRDSTRSYMFEPEMEHEEISSVNETPMFQPPPQRMLSLDDIPLVSPSPSSPSPSQPCVESGNSTQRLLTPQVKAELIPKIGQQFDNLDKVFKFYNNYAKEAGFSLRIFSSKTNKNKETIRKEYVCFKEGVRKNSKANNRRRGLTREGCRAKLSVVKNRLGEGFVVKQFVEVHNHELTTPKKVHLLKSHRRVSDAQKSLSQQLSAANVPPCQQMSFFEVQAGGFENVGFTRRDLYNYGRDKKAFVGGHDANMLYEHFERKKAKNPGFMFTFERDDEDRMTHCFWADATSRKLYQYFGDVVVFDTTYNTNKYCLIFAPLLGVNHHGQTTLFGCAFLSDESSDSFEWLLKEFLKAMPGPPPKIIITDQDLAMTKAIACVLPTTFHRYCIWHIVSKFSEKIGALAYKQYYEEFKKCIWNSESPEEFEAIWVDLVGKSMLSNNEWLQGKYEIRERWVPAFTKHIFSAHMTSSQRAEISHSFFKRYVSLDNSMLDFVTRFNSALSRLRHNELDLDHKDVNEKPILKTSYLMEKRMSEIYTLAIFKKFQEEIFQIGAYVLTLTHEDEHRCVWEVQREEMENSRGRKVSVDKLSNHVTCSCKMFEFDGIPCRHMLACLSRMQIRELPTEYILQRWTKTAKAGRVMDDLGSAVKQICDHSIFVRRKGLFEQAHDVIEYGVIDEEGTEVVSKHLSLAKKEIALMRSAYNGSSTNHTQVPVSLGSQYCFKEPLKVRAKGCGKRLKGGKEKTVKKSRKCNGCGLTGQSHDKRNCPKLLNISSQDVRLDDGDGDGDGDDDDETTWVCGYGDGNGKAIWRYKGCDDLEDLELTGLVTFFLSYNWAWLM